MPAQGSIKKLPKGFALIRAQLFKKFIKNKDVMTKDQKQFTLIAKTLCTNMRKAITEDEEGVKLPNGLGILMVRRYTPKKKITNRKLSAKIGRVICHQNLHSFGDQIKVVWIKGSIVRFRFAKAYFFKSDRELSRSTSHACMKGKNYKKIDSLSQYAAQILAIDALQEKYERKMKKK